MPVVSDGLASPQCFRRQLLHEPVVVTRNGKAVAVLLAVTGDDELERLVLAHSPKFQALLDKSRRQIEDTGGIPHDQFGAKLKPQPTSALTHVDRESTEPSVAPDRADILVFATPRHCSRSYHTQRQAKSPFA